MLQKPDKKSYKSKYERKYFVTEVGIRAVTNNFKAMKMYWILFISHKEATLFNNP